MTEDRKYFIFNKPMDYRRGTGQGLDAAGGILKQTGMEPGWFFSRVLDSREEKMIWHRLRTVCEGKSGGWAMTIYCSDSRFLVWENGSAPVEEVLKSRELSLKEKKKRMRSCLANEIRGDEDVLLFDVRGRYLWFLLETGGPAGDFDGIREIRIDFPKQSWISWLPEVYQGTGKNRDFLERYLGIFQSFYEEMTEKIEKTPELFDPDCAPADFLSWMAEWLSIEDIPAWNPEQLRYLLKNALRLYRIRGTAEYLKEMLMLYSHCEVYVVEHHQMQESGDPEKSRRWKKLYGDSPYMVTVLIHTGRSGDQKEYRTFARIARHAVPAHIECRVVLLTPYVFLDQHTYLGVNSRLGEYRPMQLDGLSAMHFSRIGQ
ncbi:Bacteriophage P2-related tail formation protein [uncultured Clostridium sp.]|nr:Bacteriophage P2-related tail formation protein [uncultured Clostridium sp.]DAX41250.1 MAG TPA: tail protein [Caudoviricetes sp.]